MITTLNRLIRNCILLIALFSFAIACTNVASQRTHPVGKYKMFSDNPTISRFIANEDNYIQLNKDNTIVYNSTINGKPKFNFKGTYSYEMLSNSLSIKWSDGKLPNKLMIEINGEDNIIKIGETLYKKESSD